MKKMTALCLLGLFAAAAPLTAATAASLDDMVKKCDECHGKDGNSQHGEVPNIGGISAPELHDAMVAFQDGDRPASKFKPDNGKENDMKTVVKDLSEDDINALAKHYAAKPWVPHEQKVDEKMAARGKKIFKHYCKKCHSEGGTVADDDASILAGQWKPYLQKEFKALSDGSRLMAKKMKRRFEKLKDKDKADIIEYLAGGSK